ncbi:MAG TPA: hypothetical protein PLO43_01105 [Chlamydiales bacterium]|nr:hypothetical protein [Chlamydiales bacterium]
MWEELAWEQTPEDGLKIRKDKQESIIDELIAKTKYHLEQGKHLPKSKLHKALSYLRSLTPHLTTSKAKQLA